jgi:hypothetical protein
MMMTWALLLEKSEFKNDIFSVNKNTRKGNGRVSRDVQYLGMLQLVDWWTFAGKYIFIGQQSLTFWKIGLSGPLPVLQAVHKTTNWRMYKHTTTTPKWNLRCPEAWWALCDSSTVVLTSHLRSQCVVWNLSQSCALQKKIFREDEIKSKREIFIVT